MRDLEYKTYADLLTISVSQTGITILKKRPATYRAQSPTKLRITYDGEIKPREIYKYVAFDQNIFNKETPILLNASKTDGGMRVSKGVSKDKNKYYTINKKEIRSRIICYVDSMQDPKELYFWTISFPLGLPDDICYQALNTWLTKLRKGDTIKEYLWVAERQQNKTLHYHMVIPHRMDVRSTNDMMRKTLMNLLRKNTYKYPKSIIATYNGVDIAKDRKTKKVVNYAADANRGYLVGYITKYMSKDRVQFKHLAWHNSRGFSNLVTKMVFSQKEANKFIRMDMLRSDKVIDTETYTFIPWKGNPPKYFRDVLRSVNGTRMEPVTETYYVDVTKINDAKERSKIKQYETKQEKRQTKKVAKQVL